jgi:prepilin-type N-terminal cleavage/methylation domain-containing protein
MNNNKGFTLIEIIVSLVIVGIMAAVAGMGIVSMVQGYDFARENVVISQKAQLVMARLRCELMKLSYIDSTNSTGSCIIYKVETDSYPYRVIRLDSDNLKLRISQVDDCNCSSPGDILSDKVGSFDILYQDEDGNDLTSGFDLSDLRSIHVSFTLDRNDGNPGDDFEITINPRNNRNLNAPGFT